MGIHCLTFAARSCDGFEHSVILGFWQICAMAHVNIPRSILDTIRRNLTVTPRGVAFVEVLFLREPPVIDGSDSS